MSNNKDQILKTPSIHRKKKYTQNFSAGKLLTLSFIFLIFIGAILLYLPFSAKKPLSIFEAIFTSTSITCVTGLSIVDMENFTRFGQFIIMILMQIGGLGFMTISFFLINVLIGNLGFTGRSIAGEILNFDSFGKIRHFVFLIIQTTVLIESVGAVLLYFQFKKIYPINEAIFRSIFYSISAFCNAGVTLKNESIIHLQSNFSILLILASLVFLGGLGFFVFYEIMENLKSKLFRLVLKSHVNKKFKRLSLHSKISIVSSLALILLGSVTIFLLERNNLFENLDLTSSLAQSFFYSVSLRSVGFFTFSVKNLQIASLLVSMVYMMIGACPGSTGGGIKTTTFTAFLATLISIFKGKEFVEINGRTIPKTQVYKTITIITMASIWIFISTFILLLTEPDQNFFNLLFEATSALSTVGLTTGITLSLSFLGKVVLIINMIAGRIGSLTFIYAIKQKHEKQYYKYPEERILIG